MTHTPTFGLSAFLKLASANDRPQRTEIRKRLTRGKKGGYDFHGRMREIAHLLLLGEIDDTTAAAEIQKIKKLPERSSAVNAIKKLIDWRGANLGELFDCRSAKFESPSSIYRIDFKWDFGITLDGRRTAVHLWNTKTKLSRDGVLGILTLLPQCYAGIQEAPDDFAVLSLKDLTIYRWSASEERHKGYGKQLIEFVEKNFELVRSELERGDAARRDSDEKDRPSAE